MVSIKAVLIFVATTVMLIFVAEARPRFSGLISLDFSSVENQYSLKGSRGCEIITNALAEDLSGLPEELINLQFRSCE